LYTEQHKSAQTISVDKSYCCKQADHTALSGIIIIQTACRRWLVTCGNSVGSLFARWI